MLDHRYADRTPPRASTVWIVSVAVVSCLLPAMLGAQAPDADTTPGTGRHCRLTVELAPATGRIEGVAIFELPDLSRFLTSSGGLPIALDPRLALEHAAVAGAPLQVERTGDDEETGLAHWTVVPAPDTLAELDRAALVGRPARRRSRR